ncbi:EAL domain-containing protein [Litoribrevibacter euphylliae]|uniref:EAL domain-containing protein n=1 Tax=Litoribrevibacter euphylliae TaxID=1834034 RepID=A0ABV7HMK0_9GAMM
MHFDAPVGEVAHRNLLFCSSTHTLQDAARMMRQQRCSSIIIKDQDTIVGIWTEADAIKLNYREPGIAQQQIQQVMTSPVEFVSHDTRVGKVVEIFRQRGYRHCLVDYGPDEQPGIISQTDITLNINIDHFLTLCKVRAAQELCLTLKQDTSFAKAVETMRLRKTDAAVVIDDDLKPIGIITQADLLKVLADENSCPTLAAVALKELVLIDNEDTLLSARDALMNHKIRHLVVANQQGRVEGVISMRHILQFLQMEYSSQLEDALSKRDEALKRSMQDLNLAERVFEHAMEGIVITDPNGEIIRINPAFTLLTGYEEHEVVGKTMSVLASGKHQPSFYQEMWRQINEEGQWSGEIWNKRKNGELFLEWLTISSVHDEFNNISHFTGLFRDVTEIRKQEEKIRHLAYFDELTGLPNRRLLKDRVSMAISGAHRNEHQLAVMFIDLDQFKNINDNFGHDVGDQVLTELAQRLEYITRDEDTLARLGGDEFVILMPSINDYEDVISLGKRINEVLTDPFLLSEDHNKQITVSIGASVYPDDGATVEDLLKHADTAMYSVKASGRNGLQLFSQEMAQRSMQHFTMEANLRSAIERNELSLHYQPKVDVITGAMMGMEALLRWHQPQLGAVSPAKFIPLAEETGLIEQIDQWVIDSACQQLRTWRDRGLKPVPVAINISPISLRHRNLATLIEQALTRHQVPANLLQIEITESAFIDDMDCVIMQLQTIKQLGLSIALDDFGTGYSSLSYLAKLPLDELKIDASFIRNVPDCETSDTLIRAITGIAKNLNLKVVVEGVETTEQLGYVEELVCDLVQGYLTGRPAAPSVVETNFSQ